MVDEPAVVCIAVQGQIQQLPNVPGNGHNLVRGSVEAPVRLAAQNSIL
jgi:hypothetical protein